MSSRARVLQHKNPTMMLLTYLCVTCMHVGDGKGGLSQGPGSWWKQCVTMSLFPVRP